MTFWQSCACAIFTIGVVVLTGSAPAPAEKPTAPHGKPAYAPTSRYREHAIEGWRVLVHADLLAEAELAEATLGELRHQLYRVRRAIPAPALQSLKSVTIWVELANPDVVGACYHPSQRWLREHGFNPDKAKGIEIGHARNFVSWTLHQPYMMLHELAHAYHHQVLGYGHPAIKQAYRQAVESQAYEQVLNYAGRQVRHYAMNNDQEYFAECSEAFFGTNDFFPFVRAELKQHDPDMHQLIQDLWNSPVSKSTERTGKQIPPTRTP